MLSHRAVGGASDLQPWGGRVESSFRVRYAQLRCAPVLRDSAARALTAMLRDLGVANDVEARYVVAEEVYAADGSKSPVAVH